jgi:hypothetical protein
MRFPLPTTWPLLALLCLSVAACGSVANRAGIGGASGSDAGTGGSGAAGSGSGGSTGAGGSASGGMTGAIGGAGGGPTDAGSDSGTSDGPRLVARGTINPFGALLPASGATIRVIRQRFGPTFACSGNTCFSGGLLRP